MSIKITKKALKEFIRYKVSSDDRWALRALIVIYNEQNEDEKLYGVANKQNGRGFGKIDASRMCPLAERYKRKHYLTPYDMITIHRVMKKYSRQLFDLSDKSKLESAYRKHIINHERIIENI